MSDLMIISADSHASEPSSLFEQLPEEYRRRAPRTEERNGGIYYIQDGQRPLRQDIAISQLTEEDKRREFRSDEGAGQGREAGTDLPLRIADLEEDGVSAEVIYPNGIFNALASPDPGLPGGIQPPLQRLVPRGFRGQHGQVRTLRDDSHGRH